MVVTRLRFGLAESLNGTEYQAFLSGLVILPFSIMKRPFFVTPLM